MRYIIASIAAVAALAFGTAQAGTLAGTYDGHCDGFSLTLAKNGAAYGVETGCLSGPITGAKGLHKGAVVLESSEPSFVYSMDAVNHTWAIYQSDGTIVQSGTWTQVGGARAPANPSAPPTGNR